MTTSSYIVSGPQPGTAEWVERMTPRQHLREAARLLAGPEPDIDDYDTARADNLAAAQVHATIAHCLLVARVRDIWGVSAR